MADFIPWTEKYRPKRVDEIVGQDHIKPILKAFVKKKAMPHMLFAGPPGVGKTTAALAIAHELYGENLKHNFLELNASDERGIDVVRGKIKEFARTLPVGDVPFKIIFLDEADALTADAQQALRRTMELYSANTRFILSCNYSSKIIEPIQSRTAVFRFLPLTKEQMVEALKRIEKGEKLKIEPEAYDALYYVSEGDMRKAINVLQSVAFYKKHITAEDVFKTAAHAHPEEVRRMLKLALSGKLEGASSIMEKMMLEYGMSGEDILLQSYKEVKGLDVDEKKKVKMLDLIGEYNFRLVEGANEKIQLQAFLAQLGAL